MKKIQAELCILAPEINLKGSHAEVSMLADMFLDGLSLYLTPAFIDMQTAKTLKPLYRAWLEEARNSDQETANALIPRFLSVLTVPAAAPVAAPTASNVRQLFG